MGTKIETTILDRPIKIETTILDQPVKIETTILDQPVKIERKQVLYPQTVGHTPLTIL